MGSDGDLPTPDAVVAFLPPKSGSYKEPDKPNLPLVKEAMGKGLAWRRHLPPALLLTAVTSLLIAAARPAAVITLPSAEKTVVLAIDVSGSMRAADVLPDRITAAKEAAKEAASPASKY